MAYSRFSDSVWYTFWAVSNEKQEDGHNAVFEVMYHGSDMVYYSKRFTADQLRKSDFDGFEKMPSLRKDHFDCLDDLKEDARQFLFDVDSKYTPLV